MDGSCVKLLQIRISLKFVLLPWIEVNIHVALKLSDLLDLLGTLKRAALFSTRFGFLRLRGAAPMVCLVVVALVSIDRRYLLVD